jgi:hypothetical protein
MNSRLSDSDSLLGTVDFRGFLETVRLRWWVIPAVVILSVGFLWIQESEPIVLGTTTSVSRSYAIPDVGSVLGAAGISVGVVQETPEQSTQILILRGTELREEVSNLIGKEMYVQVPVDFKTPFILSCTDSVRRDCEKAIELYIKKASEIRRDAISDGLEGLRTVLERLSKSVNDSSIPLKIATIDILLQEVQVEPILIDSVEKQLGPPPVNVNRPRYLFGFAAALLVSLLILLQLTLTDSRVRSAKQLVWLIGSEHYLGQISMKPNHVRDRRTAISLSNRLSPTITYLRYLPLRDSPSELSALERLTKLAGVEHVVSRAFADLSVPELIRPITSQADVIVVQRNSDKRKDVIEAFAALQRSGRQLAGVVLHD